MTIPSKPRAVIDTNVLISSVLSSKGKPRQVVRHILAHGTLLLSKPTIEELESRLARPKFRKYIDVNEVDDFINFIRGVAQFIAPDETITECRDADDNKFLEVATSGGADVLISGDGDLLALHPFRDIPILKPAEFLEIVEDAS